MDETPKHSRKYKRYLEIQKKAKAWDRLSDEEKAAAFEVIDHRIKHIEAIKRGRSGEYRSKSDPWNKNKKRDQRALRYVLVNRSETSEGYLSQMLTEKPAKHTISSARKLVPDEITLDCVERLARILGTTEQEFAASLKVSVNTWQKFKADFPEVQEALARGESDGKQALRLNNLRLGETNAAMAIHNAKHLLGQHDKSTVNVQINPFEKLMELPEHIPDYIDVELEVLKREYGIETSNAEPNADE